MSGLDKILTTIITDASESAASRMARAKEEATEYITRKNQEAEMEAGQLIELEKDNLALLASKSRSASASSSKRRLLQEKVALIDEVLEEARKCFISLSTADTFEMIERFVRKNSVGQDSPCELILNATDLARVPDGFMNALSKIVPSGITLAKTPGDFPAGCILKFGPVEYNGSADAIIHEKRDELRDLINRILFDTQPTKG